MSDMQFCSECGGELVWGICPAAPHDQPWPVDPSDSGERVA